MHSDDTEYNENSDCSNWSPNPFDQGRSIATTRALPDRKKQILERIVQTKVIPRLMIADLASAGASPMSPAVQNPSFQVKIGEFAELVVGKDADPSIAYFSALRAQGASLEALFQDLLAPAAMRLGELWDEDINDFLDVTRGFSHLQRIVHMHSEEFRAEGRQPVGNRRALLMPLPKELHTFGVSLLGQYFRREGWRVWGGPPTCDDEIIELVRDQWFDIVGLSASTVKDPRELAARIKAIRKASSNPDVKIMAGGRIFNEVVDLYREVGADATAADGNQAVKIASAKTKKR